MEDVVDITHITRWTRTGYPESATQVKRSKKKKNGESELLKFTR